MESLLANNLKSITVTKPSSKILQNLEVLDADALIEAGFYKMVLDEEAVVEAFHLENTELEKVLPYFNLTIKMVETPAKLKINKRRSSANKIIPVPLKEIKEVS